jgi:hypothetical protein
VAFGIARQLPEIRFYPGGVVKPTDRGEALVDARGVVISIVQEPWNTW